MPWPWLQSGIATAAAVNCWRAEGKPRRPEDYMPVRTPTVRQSPAQIRAVMGLIARRQDKED